MDQLSDAAERADALYSLGQALYRFGRYDEAAAAFHRGAELFDAADQQVRLRFVGAAWAAESHRAPTQGWPEGAFDGDGPGPARSSLCRPCTVADHAAGRPRRGSRHPRPRQRGLARRTEFRGPGVNLAVLALLHCGPGDRGAGGRGRDRLRRAGARRAAAYAEASLIRALVLYARGRVNEAAADAQAALDGLGQGDMRTRRRRWRLW